MFYNGKSHLLAKITCLVPPGHPGARLLPDCPQIAARLPQVGPSRCHHMPHVPQMSQNSYLGSRAGVIHNYNQTAFWDFASVVQNTSGPSCSLPVWLPLPLTILLTMHKSQTYLYCTYPAYRKREILTNNACIQNRSHALCE